MPPKAWNEVLGAESLMYTVMRVQDLIAFEMSESWGRRGGRRSLTSRMRIWESIRLGEG